MSCHSVETMLRIRFFQKPISLLFTSSHCRLSKTCLIWVSKSVDLRPVIIDCNDVICCLPDGLISISSGDYGATVYGCGQSSLRIQPLMTADLVSHWLSYWCTELLRYQRTEPLRDTNVLNQLGFEALSQWDTNILNHWALVVLTYWGIIEVYKYWTIRVLRRNEAQNCWWFDCLGLVRIG